MAMKIDNAFMHRWIGITHVLPSTLKEYECPDALGAFVAVVADAQSESEFIEKVRNTLENIMQFPVVEIEDVEILSPEIELSSRLKKSIKNLHKFPVAFDTFQFYTSIEDNEE
jgi:hypothetical protein